MKIANIEFNVDALSKMTREQFIAKFKGKLMADINKSADYLNDYFKKEEVVSVDDVTWVASNDEKPKRKRRKK